MQHVQGMLAWLNYSVLLWKVVAHIPYKASYHQFVLSELALSQSALEMGLVELHPPSQLQRGANSLRP